MNKVAAVVVTYNRKQLLKENISCLMSQTLREKMDIVIIDNHSSDGTKEVLNDFIKSQEILYRDTGRNLGGAGGFSFGARFAAECGYLADGRRLYAKPYSLRSFFSGRQGFKRKLWVFVKQGIMERRQNLQNEYTAEIFGKECYGFSEPFFPCFYGVVCFLVSACENRLGIRDSDSGIFYLDGRLGVYEEDFQKISVLSGEPKRRCA